MAMHEALITRNLRVANYRNLQNSITGVYESHLRALSSEDQWTATDRRNLSKAIFGLISKNFMPKIGSDQNLAGWVASLENTLNTSKTEQVCYDFKMGFAQITGDENPFLPKVVSKIIKTLTAMTNTKPGDCFVIVGVAESEADALAHANHYGDQAIKYRDFYITGIDQEAVKYHGSLNELEQKIVQHIDNEPIEPEIKSKIKAELVSFSYQNKQIMQFKLNRGDSPALYNQKYFKRTISHLEEVERKEELNFLKQFERESQLSQIFP